MTDLTRKRDRDRLAQRREPYWQELSEGFALGFRRGPDTWVMRHYARAESKHKYVALKAPASVDYFEAKRLAEAELAKLTGLPVREAKRGTVRAALDAYLADLRQHGRDGAADDAQWRCRKYILGQPDDGIPADPLADLALDRATRDDFVEWRERQRSEHREARTINRNVRCIMAALNRAVELGHVGNPLAWKLKPLADDTEDAADTAVFLTPAQRDALVAACEPSTATLLRGIEFTGARPHELANAVASDFDGAQVRLAHRKGRPPKLRTRYVTLSDAGVEFFAALAEGKRPGEHLFRPARSEADNKLSDEAAAARLWTTHLWGRRVRAAVDQHNTNNPDEAKRIPAAASAYSFRHSRISEMLQVHNIDPITTAQQTGTSVAMIERHYHRFIASAMRAKLASIKDGRR